MASRVTSDRLGEIIRTNISIGEDRRCPIAFDQRTRELQAQTLCTAVRMQTGEVDSRARTSITHVSSPRATS